MEPLNPPALVGEQIAGRASEVRKMLGTLSATLDRSAFDLGELLCEAQEKHYFNAWGFQSMGKFAQEELGIKERKAQYLCRIAQVCKDVGLTREQYTPAGISKLRDITSLSPGDYYFNEETKENELLAEHIVDLVYDAKAMSAVQVKEEVLRLQGRVGDDRPVVRSFSMPLAVWEGVIKPALELARKHLGSAGRNDDGSARDYSDGAALEVIVADWMSGEESVQDTAEDIPMETI